MRWIVSHEANAIIGASITPCALAMVDVFGTAKRPAMTSATGDDIAYPISEKRDWIVMCLQTAARLANMQTGGWCRLEYQNG